MISWASLAVTGIEIGFPRDLVKEIDSQFSPSRLAEQIRSGDAEAEEELVGHFGRGIGVILRAVTRDRELAEDLYQETFRLAVEKLRQGALNDPEKLGSFLAGTARNLASDHRRRTFRRRTDTAGDTLTSLPDTAPDQLGELLRKEKAALARRVIGELENPRDREMILRFYVHEEPKPAICEDLDLTPRHFDRVLFRARQRYRKKFVERVAREGKDFTSRTGESPGEHHVFHEALAEHGKQRP